MTTMTLSCFSFQARGRHLPASSLAIGSAEVQVQRIQGSICYETMRVSPVRSGVVHKSF